MWRTRVMQLWSCVAVTLMRLPQVVLVEHSTLTLKWRVYGQEWNHFVSGNVCIVLMLFIFTFVSFFMFPPIFEMMSLPALHENIVISRHHPNTTKKFHCSKRMQIVIALLCMIVPHYIWSHLQLGVSVVKYLFRICKMLLQFNISLMSNNL